ncbi:MAG: amino acid adenylation domain-containing protein [Deltaproteobacteria bacterium]|nr:amino acid adenylation domain-containing protein [Deltaproteobacteria bacterium]
MLGHFHTLLKGIVANPEQRLSDLPLLTEPERHQLLVEWNDTDRDYPRDKCIHQLFESQVERTPEAVAVVFEDQQLTYKELNRRANQLAHYLRKLGVGPEVLVGICLDRSLEMVVGLLGILKAGGAYVPLDPEYPKERLEFMLGDTRAPVLLTEERLIGELAEDRRSKPGLSPWAALRIDSAEGLEGGDSRSSILNSRIHVVSLETAWDIIIQESEENPANLATADDLAYVLYTSGSTGKPKGVAVPHRAVNRLVIHTDYVRLEPSDVIAQVSNFSFDASTFEIWGALLHGARLFMIRTDVVLSPQAFADQIDKQGITTLFLTTALFNLLAAEIPSAFRKLQHLLFGGEAVDPRWVGEILRHGPPKRLLHVYGPTETTTFASWFLVETVPQGARTIPIGRPVANTQIYLLDDHLQPVPIGIFGELYIGGDGIARAYLNRPEFTTEKFTPNPFSEKPGARLYKTGDLARYLPDGNIDFLGRIDQQVKVRGFRIEPGEIESLLGQHPKVRKAVVVAREVTPGEKRLVAYVVTDRLKPPATSGLRAFLEERLPDHMVPSLFVMMGELPMSPSGKVDRHSLPAPERDAREIEASYAAPRTAVEQKLARIWADVLGVERIGFHDDFFELGGHSLLAVKLLSRIETEFGVRLPLSTLFQDGRIEQQARLLRYKARPEADGSVVEIKSGDARQPLFLIHLLSGELMSWRPLVQHLRINNAIYGLQPPKENGVTRPFTDLRIMAEYYVNCICELQPRGPYYIAGYSFGGKVALEIAHRLVARGHNVALLAVVDSGPGSGSDRSISEFACCFLYFLWNLPRWVIDNLLTTRPSEVLAQARRKGRAVCKRIARLFTAGPDSAFETDLDEIFGVGYVPDSCRLVSEAHFRAWKDHVALPYPGRVTLFRSRTRPLFHSLDLDLGWSRIAQGGVEIRIIPGHHLSIMREPHVQNLAYELQVALDRADKAFRGEECEA